MADIEKAYSFYGTGLDSDSDSRTIADGDGRFRLNITYDSKGSGGIVQSIGSEQIYYSPNLAGDVKCIGSTYDNENKGIIYFLYHSKGQHSIKIFFIETKKSYTIWLGTGLDFEDDMIISGCVVDGMLLFTDKYPKSINIKAGLIKNSAIKTVQSYDSVGSIGEGVYYVKELEKYYLSSGEAPINKSTQSESIDLNTYIVDYLGNRVVDYENNLIIE